MEKIETKMNAIITVLDAENDELTARQEYFFNEYIPVPIFEDEIFKGSGKKLGVFSCFHYGYDNYTVITDTPIIVTLMIKAGIISIDNNYFENLSSIPQYKIDEYLRITN